MKYPIYEHFYAWQGEGIHSGRSAYFIRTYGCPLKCPWCDSAGTWSKNYIPEFIEKLDSEEILNLTKGKVFNFYVITGGEPTIFDWSEFTNKKDRPVHLETSGSFKIKGDFDWITVSPKRSKNPTKENIKRANEIKLIVEDEDSVRFWLNEFPEILEKETVWLNPEWSKRNDKDVLKKINETVKNNLNFRAGYQLHKLFLVDQEDENTKQEVPLGGK